MKFELGNGIIIFCCFVCVVLFLILKFKAHNRTRDVLIKRANKPSSRIDYSDEEIVNLDEEVVQL